MENLNNISRESTNILKHSQIFLCLYLFVYCHKLQNKLLDPTLLDIVLFISLSFLDQFGCYMAQNFWKIPESNLGCVILCNNFPHFLELNKYLLFDEIAIFLKKSENHKNTFQNGIHMLMLY